MPVGIEEVIGRIDEWKGGSISYEPLGGGITNQNWTVAVNGEKFVVRIPGSGTDMFIDRDNELACSMEAGKTGVAPNVIHHLKPENVSVVRFIEGKTLGTSEIAGSDALITRIVRTIKKIHTAAAFEKPFDPFDTVRGYMKYVAEHDAPLPADFERLKATADEIEEAVKRNPPAEAACHNDYLSENFLDDGEKIWIIDWEYGGRGDPYFDLGDFAVEHPFTNAQEELIIREYGGKDDPLGLYRMKLHKISSDWWWGVWAMIQSRVSGIDFDFLKYGSDRFDRLRKNAGDPDYKTWIRDV